MSIIIRLQNLPLSAKSGDIRHFFGGLRIPNGGVHIVGGDKGDAFIAFNSDEDARVAMRKDGDKILDCRVKLFLSSHMEMQHEIDRITNELSSRQRAPQRDRQLRGRSPQRNRDRDSDFLYKADSMSRSPLYESGRFSPRSFSPRRSRSPRSRSRGLRRSRSPVRGSSPGSRRSPFFRFSPSRSRSDSSHSRQFQRSRSGSPYERGSRARYSPAKERDLSPRRGSSSRLSDDYFKKDQPKWKNEETLRQELEKRITEVLESGLRDKSAVNLFGPKTGPAAVHDVYNTPSNAYPGPAPLPYRDEFFPPIDPMMIANVPPPNFNINDNFNAPIQMPPAGMNYDPLSMGMNPNIPPPSMPPQIPPPMSVLPPAPLPMPTLGPPMPFANIPPPVPASMHIPPSGPNPLQAGAPAPGLYVMISGLDSAWNITDLQEMLRGMFVPLKNIKWELDDLGSKTGMAVIKLSNLGDFNELLNHATYTYKARQITVAQCPDHVFHKYFMPEWPPVDFSNHNDAFFYRLKGLPFMVKDEELVFFFSGLDLIDMYIERGKSGNASGIAYAGFGNEHDFKAAMECSGRRIGHRVIHLMPSTRRAMMAMRHRNGDLFNQSQTFCPTTVQNNGPATETANLSSQRRTLCILVTGFPWNYGPAKISDFFNTRQAMPDIIHMILAAKGKYNGRALVEFNNLQSFDAAVKCHGTTFEGKSVCVKQILYEELERIVKNQKVKTWLQNANQNPTQSKNNSSQRNVREIPHFLDEELFDRRSCPSPVDVDYHNRNFPSRTGTQVFEYGNDPTPHPFEDVRHFEENYQHPKTDSGSKRNWFSAETAFQKGQGRSRAVKPIPRSSVESFTKAASEDASRVPVKFGVKNKPQVTKTTDADGAFEKSANPDAKKKLTKLSPDRQKVVPPSKVGAKNDGAPAETKPGKSDGVKIKIENITPEKNADAKNSREKTEVPPPAAKAPDKNPPKPNGNTENDKKEPDATKQEQKRTIHDKPSFERRSPNQSTRTRSSPRRDTYQSRREGFRTSPRRGRISPRRDRNVPRRDRISPRRDRNSPRRDRNSPSRDRISPRRDRISPRRDRNSPPRGDRYRYSSPSRNFDSRYDRLSPRRDGFRDRSSPPRRRSPGDFLVEDRETVVQMCNVDPGVGGPEFEDFFRGYKVCHDKIIRRFIRRFEGEEGEATGDVRVTFHNRQEAERAIRFLNKRFLNGIPVDLFIV